jgi:hypothetical protein
MAAAAAVAAGVTGLSACSGSSTAFYGSPSTEFPSDASSDAADDSPSAIAFYGSPFPADAHVPVVPPTDASSDGRNDATSEPTDARDDGPGNAEDAPSVVAFYGIASPQDSGTKI